MTQPPNPERLPQRDGRPLGTRPQRDAAMRVLISAARRGPATIDVLADIDRASADVILELAAYHGASGLLYDHLRDADGVSGPLLDVLRHRYVAAVRHHMLVVSALNRIRGAFDAAGIPWAVIKGPILAEGPYGRPGRRGYHDLDLLVHPRAFRDAVEALERLSARLLDRNWRMLRRDLRGEVLYRLPSGIPVDLHWHLVNMYRRRMRLDGAAAIERSERRELPGIGHIPTLQADDALLHLALHAALSGGDRLLWLKDLERTIAAWSPGWETVVERARFARIGPAVGLMLVRARETLGADVPGEVTDRLVGSGSLRVARWIERISPWAYGVGRTASPSRIFSRSIGHGMLSGGAWVAWRSLRNLDPRQEWRSSAFRPAGDEGDWRAFVDAVVAIGERAAEEGGQR